MNSRIGFALGALVIGFVGYFAAAFLASEYRDLAFLHQARLNLETQQRQQQQPAPVQQVSPGHVEPEKK